MADEQESEHLHMRIQELEAELVAEQAAHLEELAYVSYSRDEAAQARIAELEEEVASRDALLDAATSFAFRGQGGVLFTADVRRNGLWAVWKRHVVDGGGWTQEYDVTRDVAIAEARRLAGAT